MVYRSWVTMFWLPPPPLKNIYWTTPEGKMIQKVVKREENQNYHSSTNIIMLKNPILFLFKILYLYFVSSSAEREFPHKTSELTTNTSIFQYFIPQTSYQYHSMTTFAYLLFYWNKIETVITGSWPGTRTQPSVTAAGDSRTIKDQQKLKTDYVRETFSISERKWVCQVSVSLTQTPMAPTPGNWTKYS